MDPREEASQRSLEWFLAKAAEAQEAQVQGFSHELRALVMKWWPRDSDSNPLKYFMWYEYSEAIDAILTDMVCPLPCRGYLDGDENWHQLCLDKVQRMKEA